MHGGVEVAEEIRSGGDGVGVEAVIDPAAPAFGRNKSSLSQHTEMLRHARLAVRDGLLKVADADRSVGGDQGNQL